MIILDTNVVSELAKPLPHCTVVSYIDSVDPDQVGITAITAAEVRAGIALMPEGRRRDRLVHHMEVLLTETFDGWLIPFDEGSAIEYATVAARRRKAGAAIAPLDAQIAAICLVESATLVTRNTKDFAGIGIDLVNPWEATP